MVCLIFVFDCGCRSIRMVRLMMRSSSLMHYAAVLRSSVTVCVVTRCEGGTSWMTHLCRLCSWPSPPCIHNLCSICRNKKMHEVSICTCTSIVWYLSESIWHLHAMSTSYLCYKHNAVAGIREMPGFLCKNRKSFNLHWN